MHRQIGIEKRLDARVRRTQPAAQQLFLLVVVSEQWPGELEELRIRRAAAGGCPSAASFRLM